MSGEALIANYRAVTDNRETAETRTSMHSWKRQSDFEVSTLWLSAENSK